MHLQVRINKAYKRKLPHHRPAVSNKTQQCILPANQSTKHKPHWNSRQPNKENERISRLHYGHAVLMSDNLQTINSLSMTTD